MSIAFDAATDGGNNGGITTSLTWNHTSTGSNLIGFVGISGDLTSGSDDISSVTWGGVACTLVAKNTTQITGATMRNSYLYRIEGQATGSQSIVVTCSGTHYILAGAVSYTGASQTGQPDATRAINQTADATTDNLTSALTSVADNCWFVLLESGQGSGTLPANASTGSTIRTYEAVFGIWGLFDSNSAKTPAGSYSMTTTRNSPSVAGITHIMASFKPDTGGGVAALTQSAADDANSLAEANNINLGMNLIVIGNG